MSRSTAQARVEEIVRMTLQLDDDARLLVIVAEGSDAEPVEPSLVKNLHRRLVLLATQEHLCTDALRQVVVTQAQLRVLARVLAQSAAGDSLLLEGLELWLIDRLLCFGQVQASELQPQSQASSTASALVLDSDTAEALSRALLVVALKHPAHVSSAILLLRSLVRSVGVCAVFDGGSEMAEGGCDFPDKICAHSYAALLNFGVQCIRDVLAQGASTSSTSVSGAERGRGVLSICRLLSTLCPTVVIDKRADYFIPAVAQCLAAAFRFALPGGGLDETGALTPTATAMPTLTAGAIAGSEVGDLDNVGTDKVDSRMRGGLKEELWGAVRVEVQVTSVFLLAQLCRLQPHHPPLLLRHGGLSQLLKLLTAGTLGAEVEVAVLVLLQSLSANTAAQEWVRRRVPVGLLLSRIEAASPALTEASMGLLFSLQLRELRALEHADCQACKGHSQTGSGAGAICSHCECTSFLETLLKALLQGANDALAQEAAAGFAAAARVKQRVRQAVALLSKAVCRARQCVELQSLPRLHVLLDAVLALLVQQFKRTSTAEVPDATVVDAIVTLAGGWPSSGVLTGAGADVGVDEACFAQVPVVLSQHFRKVTKLLTGPRLGVAPTSAPTSTPTSAPTSTPTSASPAPTSGPTLPTSPSPTIAEEALQLRLGRCRQYVCEQFGEYRLFLRDFARSWCVEKAEVVVLKLLILYCWAGTGQTGQGQGCLDVGDMGLQQALWAMLTQDRFGAATATLRQKSAQLLTACVTGTGLGLGEGTGAGVGAGAGAPAGDAASTVSTHLGELLLRALVSHSLVRSPAARDSELALADAVAARQRLEREKEREREQWGEAGAVVCESSRRMAAALHASWMDLDARYASLRCVLRICASNRLVRRTVVTHTAAIFRLFEALDPLGSMRLLLQLTAQVAEFLLKADVLAEEAIVLLIIRALQQPAAQERRLACLAIAAIGAESPGLVHRGLSRWEVEELVLGVLREAGEAGDVPLLTAALKACCALVHDMNAKPAWMPSHHAFHWSRYAWDASRRPLCTAHFLSALQRVLELGAGPAVAVVAPHSAGAGAGAGRNGIIKHTLSIQSSDSSLSSGKGVGGGIGGTGGNGGMGGKGVGGTGVGGMGEAPGCWLHHFALVLTIVTNLMYNYSDGIISPAGAGAGADAGVDERAGAGDEDVYGAEGGVGAGAGGQEDLKQALVRLFLPWLTAALDFLTSHKKVLRAQAAQERREGDKDEGSGRSNNGRGNSKSSSSGNRAEAVSAATATAAALSKTDSQNIARIKRTSRTNVMADRPNRDAHFSLPAEVLAERLVDALHAFLCMDAMFPLSTYLSSAEVFQSTPVIACVSYFMSECPDNPRMQKRGMAFIKHFADNQIGLSSIAMHSPSALIHATRTLEEPEVPASFCQIVGAVARYDDFARENFIRFNVQLLLVELILRQQEISRSACAAVTALCVHPADIISVCQSAAVVESVLALLDSAPDLRVQVEAARVLVAVGRVPELLACTHKASVSRILRRTRKSLLAALKADSIHGYERGDIEALLASGLWGQDRLLSKVLSLFS